MGEKLRGEGFLRATAWPVVEEGFCWAEGPRWGRGNRSLNVREMVDGV